MDDPEYVNKVRTMFEARLRQSDPKAMQDLRGKQRDPNPKENALIGP